MDFMAINIYQITDQNSKTLKNFLNRAKSDLGDAVAKVIPILEDVQKYGDASILKYTNLFDKIDLKQFSFDVQTDEVDIPVSWKESFIKAKENIYEFHKHQLPKKFEVNISGNRLGQRYSPIDSVAIYAPGGKALYPSSILMGAIPARLAGVKRISLFTPPDPSGNLNPLLYYVSQIAGVDTIYTIGGAQAIAAAAFGTETVKKSDFVVGPGNRYVAAAKSYLASIGIIGIESIAGPSEVLIIADQTANPEWIACDLLSQAEHGEDSVAILCTTSNQLAEMVDKQLEIAFQNRSKRLDIKRRAIEDNSAILVFPNLDDCINFSNQFAPEHLEIMTINYNDVFEKIEHAGSVFLGNYSPVAMGDYISGTNHVLPTAGLSRIYSPLGVDTFLKRVTYQEIRKESIELLYPYVKTMSELEGLDEEHGTSVKVRLN
jgi:histidinol dehydrogenase